MNSKFSSASTGKRSARAMQTVRAIAQPPAPTAKATPSIHIPKKTLLIDGSVAHSMSEHQLDVIRSMGPWAERELTKLLKPVDECWQPYDFLPRTEEADYDEQIKALRERTRALPDEYLVTLVGDMITEEALPTYMAMINTLDGVRDETGASQTPWARWTRQWVAEENRHGEALNKYLWLTGRVNLRAIEVTIQKLIGSGMNPKTENNPYMGFVYTSFQERATKVSHGNTALMAKKCGDSTLAKLCGSIAADEGRHEVAYQRIVEELLVRDPDNAILCFADMMKKQITMPAHMMDDGKHGTSNPGRNLFADFSAAAERTGTYTAFDYADIVEYLVKRWDVQNKHFVSGEAAEAQEYVIGLPARIRKLAERTAVRKQAAKKVQVQFSWIFDREVEL